MLCTFYVLYALGCTAAAKAGMDGMSANFDFTTKQAHHP
jgi:hypothetical protein